MNEREALGLLGRTLEPVGDDAAVVDGQVLTTDMLHETTDFPDGTTRYTAGWRSVGASLSDVAAMGASATAAVAAYAAPTFEESEITAFVEGARDVCRSVDGAYVGGDLDDHDEFTVATTALGATDGPVFRHGASPGEAVLVTGTLGRSGAGLQEFRRGNVERGNELFQFTPRIDAGLALRPYATAMMDSSDGLARSLHQLADASGCGFAIERAALPIDEAVDSVAEDARERLELGCFFGEDFELVCTVPEAAVGEVMDAVPGELTRIGTTVQSGLSLDDDPLPDRGYTHGE